MAKKKKQPTHIEDFPIATRTINLLKNEGILISDDFANYSKKNLQEIRGLGAGSLAELLVFLKGAGIKLRKAEPKPKKEPKWDPRTREALLMVQRGIINQYSIEYAMMGKLIEAFSYETMCNVELPAHIQPPTVRYFFSGGQIAGWVENYVQKYAKRRLAEPLTPVVPSLPDLEGDGGVDEALTRKTPAEYILKPRQPKTLAEFLSLRK